VLEEVRVMVEGGTDGLPFGSGPGCGREEDHAAVDGIGFL
jgi:hypothetical protein